MSLVTACPSCGVLFKVAPDQLLISEGWVRCGKCQTVFDAALNLQISSKVPKEVPQIDGVLAQSPALEVAAQEVSLDNAQVLLVSLDASNETPLEPSAPAANPVPDVTPSDEPLGFKFPVNEPVSVQPRPSPGRWLWLAKILYLFAPLLLLALALQVVLFERNEILSREPKAKPWLVALCKPLGCHLEMLKRIQSIVIDSSTFSKISTDIYQLTLVLKNTSTVDLQLPSVELTLINSLDQPLLRRVFSVDELDVQSRTLLSLSELPLTFSFAIKAGELPDRVPGYRVLVFYP
jgi:predicted Zn finger-like uncharacterized protein